MTSRHKPIQICDDGAVLGWTGDGTILVLIRVMIAPATAAKVGRKISIRVGRRPKNDNASMQPPTTAGPRHAPSPSNSNRGSCLEIHDATQQPVISRSRR